MIKFGGHTMDEIIKEFIDLLPSNAGVRDKEDLTLKEMAMLKMIVDREDLFKRALRSIKDLADIQEKIVRKIGGVS